MPTQIRAPQAKVEPRSVDEPAPAREGSALRGNAFAQQAIESGGHADSYLNLSEGQGVEGQAKGKTAPKPKPFTKMGSKGQMAYMAKHFDANRELLDGNNVSPVMEELMAAQTPQEIDENSRRGSLSKEYQKHARRLQATLKKKKITDPSLLSEKDQAKLPEEQRFLLQKSNQGQLDLSTLGSKDKKAQATNKEQYAELGQENRSAQYAEMEQLRHKKKRSRAEEKRFQKLRRKPTHMGGNPTGMGDIWGLSQDRFSEIYDQGNTRFEEDQYKKLRRSYIKNDKRQGDPNKSVESGAGIGDFNISAAGRKEIKDSGSYDILGDIATSYGAGQIMGGYTASKDWRGKNPAERLQPITLPGGKEYTPSIEDAKKAGSNQDPDRNDLQLQMSLLKMATKKPGKHDQKAGLDQKTMSNRNFIQMYNGSTPTKRSDIYKPYNQTLTENKPLYRSEKDKIDKSKPKKP